MIAKDKVIKARAVLVLDEPFFGSLILRLKTKEDPSCKTMWVDGKTLGYNPAFVDSLSVEILKGCLCHEVMHLALSHHTRRGNRDHIKWNAAGDYAINGLIKDKFSLPDKCLFDPKFSALSAEAIYSQLPDQENESKGKSEQGTSQVSPPKGGGGQGDSAADSKPDKNEGQENGKDQENNGDQENDFDPGGCGEVRDADTGDSETPATEADISRSEADWKIAVSQAAQQAKTFGKLPAGFDRVVDDIINPRIDWRALLRRFMDTLVKTDYSWVHPNRRHIAAGLYLPSCRDSEVGTMVIGVDTSGSVSQKMLTQVAAEISSILNDIRADCHVVYCDTKVQNTEYFAPGDSITKLEAKGGGGTNFSPVFEWIEKENIDPSCVIYFTDLYGSFPATSPSYPVLWIVDGRISKKAPFGETLEYTGE